MNHRLFDQVVHCHASKLLQGKPVMLQFVSDGEALHTISWQIYSPEQKIWTCHQVQARKQILRSQSEAGSLQLSSVSLV